MTTPEEWDELERQEESAIEQVRRSEARRAQIDQIAQAVQALLDVGNLSLNELIEALRRRQ